MVCLNIKLASLLSAAKLIVWRSARKVFVWQNYTLNVIICSSAQFSARVREFWEQNKKIQVSTKTNISTPNQIHAWSDVVVWIRDRWSCKWSRTGLVNVCKRAAKCPRTPAWIKCRPRKHNQFRATELWIKWSIEPAPSAASALMVSLMMCALDSADHSKSCRFPYAPQLLNHSALRWSFRSAAHLVLLNSFFSYSRLTTLSVSVGSSISRESGILRKQEKRIEVTHRLHSHRNILVPESEWVDLIDKHPWLMFSRHLESPLTTSYNNGSRHFKDETTLKSL